MISAIIEILVLLTVSCLIGVYFTFRFWRAKYSKLQKEILKLQNTITDKDFQLGSQSDEILELQSKLLETEESLKQFKRTEKSKIKISKESEALEETIQTLEEQIAEQEREIEVLSHELEERKISYYKQIDGKRYKAITLRMADEAIAGQGDGRISKEDAEKIFDTISDGKAYTQVEKHTMRYLRDHYKWTEGADALFRKKVRSWAARDHELV